MMSMASKCVENCIRTKLQKRFNPKVLQLINESYMHNVPKDSETHFKVVIVSDEFEDMPLIKRHRLVNTALTDELKSGVHALSIVAKSPNQWKDEPVESSPNCRGGFGKTKEAIERLKIGNPNDGICDCNDEKCIGCFWPCESCRSNKCGHQCRVNREWKYEVWERQGRNNKN